MAEIQADYVAFNVPKLRLRFVVDGKDNEVQFDNKRFTTNDPALIAEIDKQLQQNPAVRSLMIKLDREAAAKVAQEHMAKTASAVRGAVTSADAAKARGKIIEASTKALGDFAPSNPAQLHEFSEELAHHEIVLTEARITPQHVDGDPKTPAGGAPNPLFQFQTGK